MRKLTKKQKAFFEKLDKDREERKEDMKAFDKTLTKMAKAINRDIKSGKIKIRAKG